MSPRYFCILGLLAPSCKDGLWSRMEMDQGGLSPMVLRNINERNERQEGETLKYWNVGICLSWQWDKTERGRRVSKRKVARLWLYGRHSVFLGSPSRVESSHAKGMRGQSCIFAQAQFIRQRAQFLPQGGGGGLLILLSPSPPWGATSIHPRWVWS